MHFLDLFLNAVATGIVEGSIYALVSVGLAITFGLLHIPNLAHPALVIAGAYFAYLMNLRGFDPIIGSLPVAILFYGVGLLTYELYLRIFEKEGRQNTLQSLTLFFGISLIIEVGLLISFGADPRSVDVSYVGRSLSIGLLTIPYRLLVPATVGPIVILGLWLYLRHTRTGLAMRAVGHDELAISIAGIDPIWIKRHAFGIATATAAIAGAALIIVGPVNPFAGRLEIGRVFAIVVLAGMGSIPGTLAAAFLIGIAESLVASFVNPSWAQGIAFLVLLLTLALRPTGLFGVAR
ncbi:MAG: branched-chain amino acid ABC transporter permease [Hyphomicrobiales bacterium]